MLQYNPAGIQRPAAVFSAKNNATNPFRSMNERQIKDLDQECEGIELLDDASDSSLIAADPISSLGNAKSSYRLAWNGWFSSLLKSTARKAELAKLRLANLMSPYVRGVTIWPVLVVYTVVVAGLFILASMLPLDFSWLPWIIRIGLMGAGMLIPVILLLLSLVILRDARKEPGKLQAELESATLEYEQARKLHLTNCENLEKANANLRITSLQVKLLRRNQAESQRSTRATLSELSLFTTSLRWRYLTGETWEGYLEQIFLKHGYKVERTKVTGDQGVDLIVSHKRIRLAVQAKGYSGSVGNKAVQEVVAGRIYYQCTHSAVITNSSFTKSAHELAEKTNCILIDGSGIGRLHSHGLKHMVS
jgi:HJR/Mrr/RecB family endonuclease